MLKEYSFNNNVGIDTAISLNPYFNGTCSKSLSYEEIGVIKGDVLILILMEHAQRASISLSYLYQ